MADFEKVLVLLTLELNPNRTDTRHWPVHMMVTPDISAYFWGGLDAVIRTGLMEPGEASHLVALTFDDKDYPDWLPKATLAGPWCSRMITPIVRHSLKGDTGEGVQLSPLGSEPPTPQLQPDSVRVTLRGVPVGEPIFRECEHEELGWGCQGMLEVKAAWIHFRAYRFLTDRDKLQEELDYIIAAGEVQITGRMEDGGAGDKLIPEVIVEHWAPVEVKP